MPDTYGRGEAALRVRGGDRPRSERVDSSSAQCGYRTFVGLVSPWQEEAVKGTLDAILELWIVKFAVDGQLKLQEAANQQAMLDRIDKLKSFAKLAPSLCWRDEKSSPAGFGSI